MNAAIKQADASQLLRSEVVAQAVSLAEATDAPAVIVRITERGSHVVVTCTRQRAAGFLRGTDMTLPPPGGVVVIVADKSGALACGRVRTMPMVKGGIA